MSPDLIKKLESRKATVGILGMGYVGQPLALRYANLGYKVLGLDIDAVKVSDFSNNNGFCQFWYIAPSVL